MSDHRVIESRSFNLPAENIDTDQIYPARFLTTTASTGLGRYCFRDWRDNPQSRFHDRLKERDAERQRILVAGPNFGCGSSREHASWALLDAGFRAVISSRFGDIFYSNALKNGLLLVTVDFETLQHLLSNDDLPLRIGVEDTVLEIPDLGPVEFPLDAFARHCIMNGIDTLDFLLQQEKAIDDFEERRA